MTMTSSTAKVTPLIFYGWKLSYYSGKTFTYLCYKEIPLTYKVINAWDLNVTIKKKTGHAVMPVVMTPEGKWIQDSRAIIDAMEKKYTESSVFPTSARRKFATCLIESWCDEMWVGPAMHYRWNFPESVAFFKEEAANNLLPSWAPSFVRNKITDEISNLLIRYMPILGVKGDQIAVMENWTVNMLRLLDDHFAHCRFLLGSEPTLGDFGLAGPLIAHLYRDPWPRDNLFQNHPNLIRWIKDMETVKYTDISAAKTTAITAAAAPVYNDENDEVPKSLDPILNLILAEFVPLIESTLEAARETMALPQYALSDPSRGASAQVGDHLLPRIVMERNIAFPMLGVQIERKAAMFTLWKAQQVIDVYQELDPSSQKDLEAWLDTKHENGSRLVNKSHIDIPGLDRVGLKVRLRPLNSGPPAPIEVDTSATGIV